MNLSAIVITRNEEANIERCIKSLSFADEVIVIDAESDDKTAAIAQELGAKVIIHPWQGYGQQKNFGASQATSPWLLFVDADEEVTPDLAKEISKTVAHPEQDVYWMRIVTTFLHRPLRHLYGHNPRLFRKAAASWTTSAVHEQVILTSGQQVTLGDNASGLITEPLLHHSHPTVQSYLQKMHRYTTLDAQQIKKTGKHRSGKPITANWALPYRLAARQLVKLLFYRRGILDGLPGILWCTLSAYYEYEMAKKFLAL